MELDLTVIRGLSLWRGSSINRGGVLVLEQRIHLRSVLTFSRVYPVCTTPGMSSSSAYYLSSRHSDSEEEWTVSNSPCSDSSQSDDEDFVGAEEFSALRHLGYE